MKHTIRLSVVAILIAVSTLIALGAPVAVAHAQEADTTGTATTAVKNDAPDVEAAVAQTQRYVDALVLADLDGNDIADFDASNDGIAELPLTNFADLDALPGTDDFAELIRSTFELGLTVSSNDVALSDMCGGMAISFDADGNLIDWALGLGSTQGGGPNGTIVDLFPQSVTGTSIFTKDNPFIVGERVVVLGQLAAEDGKSDTNWSVSSAGVVLGSGRAVMSPTGEVLADDIRVADHALGGVAQPVGVFPLTSTIEATDVFCQTSGWVQFDQGQPLLTNVGIAASGLSVVGVLGLFLNARPARAWKTEEKA